MYGSGKKEEVSVSGPLMCEKAIIDLYKTLHKDAKESDFTASEEWKWRFCKRHRYSKAASFSRRETVSEL